MKGWPSKDPSGNIHAVIEIPAGRTEKWEVDKKDGNLKWNFKKGRPRVLKYIGYPGNYGMVPETLLPKESGGDGDPLDIILLGPPIDRGEVATAKLIGVLKLDDNGEQDDKLIAVQFNSPLKKADSIEETKTIFETLQNTLETKHNRKAPNSLNEVASNRNSSPFLPRKQKLEESVDDVFSKRMRMLAGIK